MSLTDTEIRNAKPRTKDYRLSDGEGLAILVGTKGQKWWRFRYFYRGTEKMLSLGVYPKVTLSNARKRRNEARELLEKEINPSENRKAQKATQADRSANSFEVVAREWFTKHSPGWSKSHSDRAISRLEGDVFPWIGENPISEIVPSELLKVMRRIEERGALETAHRVLQTGQPNEGIFSLTFCEP
ncbi:MAG: protein of unknown function (DUF4102) [Candidatus Kentron sp. G]|nr:MAG: protein of unknown function (DUF4102) [Candidatus Kentron sp. G]VFN02258.1 MAG: protein of unknown function (DUF4102) [Candidatus Kentron sp. G]VFN06441.1 MAG: protein of unknown function (DUF4102) [Candidatus Kentron sp. G]